VSASRQSWRVYPHSLAVRLAHRWGHGFALAYAPFSACGCRLRPLLVYTLRAVLAPSRRLQLLARRRSRHL